MSYNPHDTHKLGFEYEVTEGTDVGGLTPYNFFKAVQSFGNFPSLQFILNSYYAQYREPTIKVVGADPKGAAGGAIINALMFYLFGATTTEYWVVSTVSGTVATSATLTGGSSGAIAVAGAGGVTTYGDETSALLIASYTSGSFTLGETVTHAGGSFVIVEFLHYMTFFNAVDHQPFTTRFQTEGSGTNIRKSMTGCKTKNVNFTVFNANSKVKTPAIGGMGYIGRDIDDPTRAGDLTYVDPASQSDIFFVDKDNSYWKWDTAGDNVDLINYLLDFKYIGDSETTLLPLVNQVLPDSVIDGNKVHIFQISMLRGDDISLHEDALAQKAEGYTSTKHMKMRVDSKNGTHYIILEANTCFIQELDMNHPNSRQRDKDTFNALIVPQSLYVWARDDLQGDTWYGV